MNQSTPAEAVITDEATVSRHTVHLELETTQAFPAERSNVAGRMFRIENLHLEYSRTENTPWRLQVAIMGGVVLKSNGAPGKLGTTVNFARFNGELDAECPAWIAALVERYRPVAAL
jgi:hypothetical protein